MKPLFATTPLNVLKRRTIVVVLYIILSVSLKAFSQECGPLFEASFLSKEKYSEAQLDQAMKSLSYSQVIEQYPKMKDETEVDLIKSYRGHNDGKAFQALFLSNIGLVRRIVGNHVRKRGGSFEDLFQEGLIALLKAIEHFDPSETVKMSTYVNTVVRRFLTRYKEKKENIVAIKWTAHWRKLRISLLKKITSEQTDNITEDWIRRFAEENPQYSVQDIRSVLLILLYRTHVSLDETVRPDKNLTLLDTFSDQNVDVESKAMSKVELLKVYNWIMKEIKDRRDIYRVIVTDRLFSFNPRSSNDIAQEFNITHQRVDGIERFIKNKIKNQFPDISKSLANQ